MDSMPKQRINIEIHLQNCKSLSSMVPQDSNYSDIRANNFAVFAAYFAVWKDRKLIPFDRLFFASCLRRKFLSDRQDDAFQSTMFIQVLRTAEEDGTKTSGK